MSTDELRPAEGQGRSGESAIDPHATVVFRELDRWQIAWALLRAPAGASGAGDGDIDVLVDPSDLERVERIFRALGFISLRDSASHFVRYHAPSDRWLWFHVVHELSFGPGKRIKTGAEQACLARRIVGDVPARLAPDDEFWALLLHCVFDKRDTAPRHRARLRELALDVVEPGPLARFVAEFCGNDVVASAVELARRDHFEGLQQAMWVAERGWVARHPVSVHVRLRARLRRIARSIWRSGGHRGLSVALLGPDGAGKSTLAASIAATSRLPVRIMYMGLTGGALKRAARLRVPGVVFAARAVIVWQRYLRARLHQAQGRLVVFDRYVLDAEVPHPQPLTRLQRLSRRMDGHLCPLPDLVLILDAPGDVMHRRKGEYSPEMLEDWRRHFLALRRRGSSVEVIDATRDKETVRIDAMDRIWRRYLARDGARE